MNGAELSNWWYDKFGACGCGRPEDAAEFLRDLLAALDLRRSFPEVKDYDEVERRWKESAEAVDALFPSDGLRYFVLYVIDHLKLAEHGGSVNGCWLTDEGREVLEALKKYGTDPGLSGWEYSTKDLT